VSPRGERAGYRPAELEYGVAGRARANRGGDKGHRFVDRAVARRAGEYWGRREGQQEGGRVAYPRIT